MSTITEISTPQRELSYQSLLELVQPHVTLYRARLRRVAVIALAATAALIPLYRYAVPEYLVMLGFGTDATLVYTLSTTLSLISAATVTLLYAVIAKVQTSWDQYALPDEFLLQFSRYVARDVMAWNLLINRLQQQGHISLGNVKAFLRKEVVAEVAAINLRKPGATAMLNRNSLGPMT